LEFYVPFQHKYGYIRDEGRNINTKVSVTVKFTIADDGDDEYIKKDE